MRIKWVARVVVMGMVAARVVFACSDGARNRKRVMWCARNRMRFSAFGDAALELQGVEDLLGDLSH